MFREWCEREGVIMPKLEYPAFFDNGLEGIRVKEEIKHQEIKRKDIREGVYA